MANNGMSGNDFMKMQREAEQRAMEMQRRAKNKAADSQPPPANEQPSAAPKAKPHHSFLDMLNIRSFFESKDTSLVLMVLALLNSENTDPLLMLALLYIVM